MKTEDANQASLEDLRKQALEHYTEASNAIHHWSSFVEHAIKEYNPICSLNPESIIAFANYFHKEKELMRRTGQMSNGSITNPQELYQKFFSDLCSGSQEEEDEIICRDGYIIFPKNNNIPYGQDFNFWQNIPSKIKFYPAFFGNERIKFIGDGYGILNDNIYKLIGKYGNGAIFVSVKDLPENVKEYCMNNLLNSL